MANVARPTMQQIADELGVSRRTVSSVINERTERDGISAKTAKRIRKYLRERRFIPSSQAVQLRKGTQGSIGIMHTAHLYGPLLQAYNLLTNLMADTGRQMELMVQPNPGFKKGFMELLSRGVTSFLWICTSDFLNIKYSECFDYLDGRQAVIYNFPFGSDAGELQHELIGKGINLVGINRYDAHMKTARHLYGLGHRRVCFPACLSRNVPGPVDAVRAFIDCGYEYDFYDVDSAVVFYRDPRESGKIYASGIIEQMKKNGATVAEICDDLIAAFTIDELLKAGVRVPEDISVIGFDNLEVSQVLQVPLTTIRLPVSDMVKRVMEILAGEHTDRAHCFEAEYIKSASHAPAPAHHAVEV